MILKRGGIMDYRMQRLKEDLTNAQQRNKKQRIQLANYKRVHERDLETIKKYKEVIDKAINNSQYWIDYYTRLNSDERIVLRLQENIDILKEVK